MFDIKSGQRVTVTGKTGSGKTTLMCHLVEDRPTDKAIILDCKGDSVFETLSDSEVIHGLELSDDKNTDVFIVRPTSAELSDPELLDKFLLALYNKCRNVTVVIDEAYMIHSSGGRAGPGLIGLVTRGRSRKIGTWIGTQRPAWASRFCFSESEHFFVMMLSHPADRKLMSEYTGCPLVAREILPPYEAWHITGQKMERVKVNRFRKDSGESEEIGSSEKQWKFI